RTLGKRVYSKGYPGFESLSLRHVFNNLETLPVHLQSINGSRLYSHPHYLSIRLTHRLRHRAAVYVHRRLDVSVPHQVFLDSKRCPVVPHPCAVRVAKRVPTDHAQACALASRDDVVALHSVEVVRHLASNKRRSPHPIRASRSVVTLVTRLPRANLRSWIWNRVSQAFGIPPATRH